MSAKKEIMQGLDIARQEFLDDFYKIRDDIMRAELKMDNRFKTLMLQVQRLDETKETEKETEKVL